MKPILCYGDLHAGSISGLWPPKTPKGEGGGVKLNYNQRAMWKVWRHLLEERLPAYLKTRGLDGFPIAVNMGDSIDGRQTKQKAVCVETADLTAQTNAAVKAQKPLMDMVGDLYVLEGTPYHEGNDYLSGELMAEKLKIAVPNERTGKLTHRHLFLTLDGIRFMFKHELSYFQVYKSTPLERELLRALRKAALEYAKERDVLGFGHIHTSRVVQLSVGKELKGAFTIPCLQVESRWATRKSVFNTLADFGMVVVEVYGKDHDPPFVIVPLTYPVSVRKPKEYIYD